MADSRLVFLTGATGFIGTRLVRRLSERGHRLRCLVREGSATGTLEELDAELVRGSLTDRAMLADALVGVDLAYHLAGHYDVGVVDSDAMRHTNVDGTRAFLAAIEAAGTPRAVYTSTTVALGPVKEGEGDERAAHGPRFTSVYERTKTEAHRLAVASQSRGLPLVIVAPANVYGPGDEGPNGRFIGDLLTGRIPGFPLNPSWFSYVQVDDVAEGLVLAGEEGRPGATYVLSGEAARLDDFARRICALAGRRPPRLRFPAPLIRWTGTLLDALTRVTRIRFPISRETAATASGLRWLHSHTRATRELGWTPRPLDEGLPETVRWYMGKRIAADSRSSPPR